jgi:hypothetical protein
MFHGRAIFLVDVLVNAIAAVLLLLFTLSPRLQAVDSPPPRNSQSAGHVLLVSITLDQNTSAQSQAGLANANPFRRISVTLVPPSSKNAIPLAVPAGRLPWRFTPSADPKQYDGYSSSCGDLQGVVLDEDQIDSIVSARALGRPGILCPDLRTLQVALPCLRNVPPGGAIWQLTLTYATSDLVAAPPLTITKPQIMLDDEAIKDQDVTMDNTPPSRAQKSCNSGPQQPQGNTAGKCELRADADIHVSWRQPAKGACNQR